MAFKLIKGSFWIVGKEPDGDSVRFKANRKSNWNSLDGPNVKLNKSNQAQLRIEAIDTLETHYRAGTEQHQPQPMADDATDKLLSLLGFRDVVWSPGRGRVTSVRKDGMPGYILARSAERFGRPVCFVYAGSTNRADGSDVFLDVPWMRKSANYKMLASGMAYPTYYTGLFYDLRNALTSAAVSAFNRWTGVWPYDWTNIGVPVRNQAAINDDYVMMPKLFRRISEYNHANTQKSFKQWLKDKGSDPIHVLTTGHFTRLDTVIAQNGNRVRLTVYPEDIVFTS